MSCPRKFLIVRYHIGDLEASEAETIREHLEECKRCREVLAGLEREREDFLKDYPADQAVREMSEELDRRERSWRWRLEMWWLWWSSEKWKS